MKSLVATICLGMGILSAVPADASSIINQTLNITAGSDTFTGSFAKFDSALGTLSDIKFEYKLKTLFTVTNYTLGSTPRPSALAEGYGDWADSTKIVDNITNFIHPYSFVPKLSVTPSRNYGPYVHSFTATDQGGLKLIASRSSFVGGASDTVVAIANAFTSRYRDRAYSEYFDSFQIGFAYKSVFQAGSELKLRYDYTPAKTPPPPPPSDPHDPTPPPVAAVPEPATWLLMMAGVFSIGAMLRRGRTQRGAQPEIGVQPLAC